MLGSNTSEAETYINQYIQLCTDFYPVLSTHWCMERSDLTIYSPEIINQGITSFRRLKDELEYSDVEHLDLIAALNARIFELEVLQEWKEPSFYLIHSIHAVSVWNNYEGLIEGVFSRQVIQARVKDICAFFSEAKKILSAAEIPRLHLLNAIGELKALHKRTAPVLKQYIPDEQYQLYNQEVQGYHDFLILQLPKSLDLIRPWGKSILESYVHMKSGIRLDSELFLSDLIVYLKELCSGQKKDETESAVTSKIEYQSELQIIMELGQTLFPWKEDFDLKLESLDIREAVGINEMRRFGYLFSNNLQLTKPKGILLAHSQDMSLARIQLGLIHEWYPGHHYSRIIKTRRNYKEGILLENQIFEEGWAKYCEYFFAYHLVKTNEIKNEFNKGLMKSVLLAMAVVLIHAKRFDFKTAADFIHGVYEADVQTLHNICIQAYFSPVESLSYILGFFAVSHLLQIPVPGSSEKLLLTHNEQLRDLPYSCISQSLNAGRVHL